MSKEERQRVILEFLAEHQLALPPLVIYRNLRYVRGFLWSDSVVRNYLQEFAEDGLVKRVDPQVLAANELVEVSPGEQRRAYYLITDAGEEYLDEL